ncbi:MAG: aldo/keto reductase [Synechococcales cyanobacterium SupBloom_Metag_052]|jgi:alcohol dehydrogenase (NADP+)|nr:aldo/keto reductase [Synechococcales cyanobacterium SupBloom_Metag_052]
MASLGFANGDSMPSLGLGTWKAAGGEVAGAVTAALELGYRHFDCASIYGNEAEIGESLKQAFAAGGLQRDQLWITSKLWNDCHAPEDVRPALERTLADLGLATLDLYLIHWPVAHRHGVMMPQQASDQLSLEQRPIAATWRAMEALVRAGLVRHIGVSNFSQAKLATLLAGAELAPEVNQVERHPYLQQPELLAFCQANAIQLTAYAPLGSPPAGASSPLLGDPVISAIAVAHGSSAAQVLLAWGIACGTAVIPKSVHPQRLAANLAAAQLSLSATELAEITALDRGERFIGGGFWDLPGGTYNLANLWDEPIGAA